MNTIVFFTLATFLVGSSACALFLRNPVSCVLCLILAFFNAAGLFVQLGAELIAMMLVIVYVGAIAVLFLFIVMMLAPRQSNVIHKFSWRSLLVFGAILSTEFAFLGASATFLPSENMDEASIVFENNNAQALGKVLFTDYVWAFQLSGLVLLVAMMGAIVLCLSPGKNQASPSLSRVGGRPSERRPVRMVNVPSGAGVTRLS